MIISIDLGYWYLKQKVNLRMWTFLSVGGDTPPLGLGLKVDMIYGMEFSII